MNEYVGRQACGRILNGTLEKGQVIMRVNREGKESRHTITRIEA